jgi:dolichyl-phosphate-mannose--protein O-mannosyl transferase
MSATVATLAGGIKSWMTRGLADRARQLRLTWQTMSFAERMASVFLAAMVVGGVVLRIQDLAWPTWFTFDEEPFVKNAHSYPLAIADNNDHPPLGKMLIAVGMLVFGYNSLGWRFIPLLFGLQSICLAYWLGRVLFDSRRAGFMAAAFMAADGFFISYSRSGLLDGMMISFMLWGMVAALAARTWRGVLAAGVLIGLSTSIKWSGAMTAIPAAVGILILRRVSIFSVLWLGVVPVVHTLIWMGALRLTGKPSDPVATWRVIIGLYKHHLDLGHYKNDLCSPWYGWPILMHPVVIKASTSGLKSRYSSSVGNLVLWATTDLLLVAIPVTTLVIALRTRFRRYWLAILDRQTMRGVWLMLLGWFAFMAPWLATRSTRGNYTFSHYYLPCYAFLLVLLAGLMAKLERRYPWLVTSYLGLALAMAIFFAPVWGEFSLTSSAANLRLWFPAWRP